MDYNNRNKLRMLYLYQYLVEYTDPEHTMSTVELTHMLKEEYGLHVSRNTITGDLVTLHDCGLHIEHYESTQNRYYYDGQLYSTAELRLLADAIASSRFITQRKSEELIAKLFTLTNRRNAAMMWRHVYVAGRVKSENESGYYIVDVINNAIDLKKKITFYYTDFDADKQRFTANDGRPYTFSPYALIWDSDYYYVRGYCDEHQAMRNFRLDRIEKCPTILNEIAVMPPEDFNPVEYGRTVFRMYDTDDPLEVQMICKNGVMKYLIDQFGENFESEKIDSDTFRATVRVCPSVTFYSWVFGFNGQIRIAGPEGVVEEYRQMLLRAAEGLSEAPEKDAEACESAPEPEET